MQADSCDDDGDPKAVPSSADDVSRRGFIGRAGMAALMGGSAGAAGMPLLLLAQEDSGPIDCGPPPPAAPQHRTGGESFAPLPLPVTPLRRSEKKKPPTPPALVGKMAMGPVRWVTRDGKRVQQRDWMTDPADVHTLLEWTNSKLGVQYGSVEADFSHFSFDPRELPALLFAGHNEFTLDDATRQSLARYVMDGGTIIGDACCGWKDFAESFRREMALVFPQRPLRKLLPDDPLHSAYYKVPNLDYKRADGSVYSEESCLEGIDFGCRTGVIFSPCDLTCGWDGHEHPRGLRVTIDDARKVGANLVTYILGSFQLGRFLSGTKVYFESDAPTRDDFVLAQIVHEGDWDPDPSAIHNLLKFARDNSTLEVKFKRAAVQLKSFDQQSATYPLLYMTGHREFAWSDEEASRLQRYLKAGGMLLADACCGRLAFDRAFRHAMAKALPESKLERLPPDHPIYHALFDLRTVEYTPRVREDFGAINAPELEGIAIDGRLAVVYSRFDLGNGWEQFAHPYSYGLRDDAALQLGTNAIVYAMTH